jgi:hypothetical protein
MNMRACFLVLAAALASAVVNAQGPLVPPGPPGPTFKTLQQVEPRTPISSLPFAISSAGSYYLTTNLTGTAAGGITISASGVTLDLMGFEMVGGAAGSGVRVFPSGQTNVCVRNGTVRGWQGWGVDIELADNSMLENLLAAGNGLSGPTVGGLRVGNHSIARNCTSARNGGGGIIVVDGVVSDCTARFNGGSGITTGGNSTVTRCAAANNGFSGISTGGGSTIVACTAGNNGLDGIAADTGSTVSGCTVNFNTGDGIQVSGSCRVVDNACHQNGSGVGDGAGIHATGAANRIDSNNVTSNDRGIDVDVVGNLIIRNSASGNAANYSAIVAGNSLGEIVDFTAAGGTLNETHGPWANISF